MPPRPNPLDGFTIDPAAIRYVGEGLQRPECILAERDGSLWSADARGGVVHIRPDGTQALITQTASRGFAEAADEEARFVSGTLPNSLSAVRFMNIRLSRSAPMPPRMPKISCRKTGGLNQPRSRQWARL